MILSSRITKSVTDPVDELELVANAMLSGKRIVVREGVDEVIDRIVDYRKRIGAFKNEE